jgi:uncharacterized protein (TIGR02246 family)
MKRLNLASFVVCALAPLQALAADFDQAAAEAAVRKAGDAYVEAFNKHDAKAVANFWSPDAVYINQLTGEQVTGREAIAGQFTDIFKDRPDVKLDTTTASIDFVSPNVGVEHGTAKLSAPKGEQPTSADYTAVYVRRDGQWLLDRVTDKSKQPHPSHYEQLKELEWMIGSWVDQDDKDNVVIETDCNWTKNKSFLTRMYSISVDDEVDIAGEQVIGWDAAAKAIRSWTFDSDGGFSEATWTHKGDRWFVNNKGVLGDGRKASAVNIIKKIDDNSFTWQTTDRTAGGEPLANVDEIVIVRK